MRADRAEGDDPPGADNEDHELKSEARKSPVSGGHKSRQQVRSSPVPLFLVPPLLGAKGSASAYFANNARTNDGCLFSVINLQTHSEPL